MRIGGLSLFVRLPTSRGSWNIAAWHSRHSLTWRWIVHLSRQPFGAPRPYAFWRGGNLALGLGQLIGTNFTHTNTGWRFRVALFWIGLELLTQRPMWFCDLYRRERDERDRLNRISPYPPPPVPTPLPPSRHLH